MSHPRKAFLSGENRFMSGVLEGGRRNKHSWGEVSLQRIKRSARDRVRVTMNQVF
jgi:hypothetical protein